MTNKYSLLNYDQELVKPTEDFLNTQLMIDTILADLAASCLTTNSNLDPSFISEIFYENFHFGSIQDTVHTGHEKIDDAIELAVEKLKELNELDMSKEAGIGDTATDEAIAYELEELLTV